MTSHWSVYLGQPLIGHITLLMNWSIINEATHGRLVPRHGARCVVTPPWLGKLQGGLAVSGNMEPESYTVLFRSSKPLGLFSTL